MKVTRLFLIGLFFYGIFAAPSIGVSNNLCSKDTKHPVTSIVSKPNSQQQPVGSSPFIRFHHGIDESGVSVSSPSELIISLIVVNNTPEKFAGITEYLASLSFLLPVTREFLYSTPLRSPPCFC